MAVSQGECSPSMEVEVRKRAKRSAEVDMETAPSGKGPKLEVGQARPHVEDLEDHTSFLTLKNISVERFNSFERHRKYEKMFRYMRYREATKEVEVVEDGTVFHEAPIVEMVAQVSAAVLANGGSAVARGAIKLIPNAVTNLAKVPDGCWVARGATGPLIDYGFQWPTVVLEVAFSETTEDLAGDVRQWLVPENPVQLVIAIKIGKPLVGGGRTMWLELHRRHKNRRASAPKNTSNGRIHFGRPRPQVPQAQAPQPQAPQAQAQITVNIPWLYFYANDAQVLQALGLQNHSTSFEIAAAIATALANPNQLQVLPNYAQGHFTLDLDAIRNCLQ